MTKFEIAKALIEAAHINKRNEMKVAWRMARHSKTELENVYNQFKDGKLAAGFIIHCYTGIVASELL